MIRWQGFSRLNNSAQPAPVATITVYLKGTGTLATLYTANDPTKPGGNPFTVGTDGYGYFYAPNGRYDVQFSGGGIATPYSLGDVMLNDPGTLGS